MKRSARSRLTEKEEFLFPGDTLFEKIARAVCSSGTLPRKELFEAWETARRIRRVFRGGRILDLACGHGLLAHIMLILDNSSPEALAVDVKIPDNSCRLSKIIIDKWPRLKDRIHYQARPIESMDYYPDDILISVHACGNLTDIVIEQAISAGARVAVLPCCHDTEKSDTGDLTGWLDGPMAIDVARAFRLKENGYRVMTKRIPGDISPENRLLMAEKLKIS